MVVAEAKDMNLYYILNTSNELKEKMNTNQLVYIYFFKDDCTACSSFKEVLNSEIEKKGLKIYAVNINNKAMKYFGGITGDLAGYFLCLCEVGMAVVLAVVSVFI